MNSKHTPGPWNVCRTISGNGISVEYVGENSDGEKSYNAMVECDEYFIAGVGGVGKDQCAANAHLIAAAPALLAALEACLASCDSKEIIHPRSRHTMSLAVQEQARAAIRKANGEA